MKGNVSFYEHLVILAVRCCVKGMNCHFEVWRWHYLLGADIS